MEFFLPLGVSELTAASIQGKMSYAWFYENDEDVAAYQAALGMSADQVTQLAKKQAEMGKGISTALVERLVRIDELSPEDVSLLDNDFRASIWKDIEIGQASLEATLTPEQLQQMQELDLALANIDAEATVFPTVNLNAYNVLGLSDGQKKELEKLKNKTEAETIDFMKGYFKETLKVFQGQALTPEDAEAQIKKGAAMTARIKASVLALLTREQTAKYEQILAEWPKKIEQLKADWLTKQKEKKPEDDEWKKSWKPGDPIPEGAVPPYRPRRAFPLGG
jgi:hypothetical protein